MRTSAAARFDGRMKVVSETLNWRASACICAWSSPVPSSTTASGFPDRRAPPAVKTLRIRNLSCMRPDYFTTIAGRCRGNPDKWPVAIQAAASTRARSRNATRRLTDSQLDQHPESAEHHALAIERHRLRIHHARESRIAHGLGVDAVAILARLVDDPREPHFLALLEFHALRERGLPPVCHVV